MKIHSCVLCTALLFTGLFSPARGEAAMAEARVADPLDGGEWSFSCGPEYPGAKGSFEIKDGRLLMNADFRGGGGYVAVQRKLPVPTEIGKLNFTVKGVAGNVAVRFFDSSGQTHQHFFKVAAKDGEPRSFSVAAKGSPEHHWGGPNDGRFTGPVTGYALVVHRGDLGAKQGVVEFSGISVDTSDPRIYAFSWSVPSPESLFRRPGDETPVAVRVSFRTKRVPGDSGFVYYDYSGGECLTGNARYDEAAGLLLAPPPPGRGFYELAYPELKIRIGVAVDDAPPAKADEYFAVDGSFSWGGKPGDEAGIRSYLRILKDNGIVWNRDRLSWKGIEPQAEGFDFGGRFGLYRRLAAEEGIKTLDTFHDAPAWSGADPRHRDSVGPHANLYPEDLLAAGRGLATIVGYWSDTVDALEVWNEPDIGFGNHFPAAYVTAFTKAVSRAFSERGLNRLVVGGVFANTRPNTGFYDTYVRNGLLDDSDVISYHSYADTPAMEQEVAALRAVEAKYGYRPGIPLWITECGKPWPRGGYRSSVSGDINSAAEITGKAVELRALGLERFFAFEYKYYDERQNNFGMMDDKYTPMRSMAAYGHLARVLAHRGYIGDLKGTEAVRARVFEGSGDLVAVLYCGVGENRRTSLALPAGLPVLRAAGADGRPFEVRGSQIPLGDGIAYVYLPKTARSRFVDAGTGAMKLYRMAKEYKPVPRAAKPLVLQPVGDISGFLVNTYGFYVRSGEMEFKVKINNFSGEEIVFRPGIELPEGAKLLAAPEETAVPRRGSAVVGFRISIDPAETPKQFRTVVLKDRGGMATPIAFSVRPYRVETVKARPASAMGDDGGWLDFGGQQRWTTWPGGAMSPNIGAKLRVFYTPGELIMQVKVDDPSHHNSHGAEEAWRGDSVQLTLQQRGADGMPPAANPRWNEITAANCRSGNALFRHIGSPAGLLGASTLDFRHDGAGSFYELRFDAKELGLVLKPGSKIGSAVLVNSDSGRGRDGYLSWGSGIADGKSDRLFNLIELE